MGAWLYAVADGVFEQGLQYEGGHAGEVGGGVQVPLQAQALAKAHFFYGQIAPRQLQLLLQCAAVAHVLEHVAKDVAQVFEHGLGAVGVGAYQCDGAVEGVEQEVRADAGLQFGQLCLHVGRGLQLAAQ